MAMARFTITCPECRGRKECEYYAEPETFVPTNVRDGEDLSLLTITKVTCKCRKCTGLGWVLPTEPIPVMQCGRQVGTVPPSFDPTQIKSTNWLYAPRPGDFWREGGTWVANNMLGPSDLEAVPGYVRYYPK